MKIKLEKSKQVPKTKEDEMATRAMLENLHAAGDRDQLRKMGEEAQAKFKTVSETEELQSDRLGDMLDAMEKAFNDGATRVIAKSDDDRLRIDMWKDGAGGCHVLGKRLTTK